MQKVKTLVGRPWFSAAALIVAAAMSGVSLVPLAYGQGITTGTISGTDCRWQRRGCARRDDHRGQQQSGYESRDGTSESNGEFSFFAVPIGQYTLTISATGFANATVNAVQVNAGATSSINAISWLAAGQHPGRSKRFGFVPAANNRFPGHHDLLAQAALRTCH